jgi:hypothetical protein
MSSKRPTLQDCLRELGRLIQQDHGPTCVTAEQKLQAAEKDAADTSNQVLMLHSRLKIIQARAAQANKDALEAEKERDELHTQIEEIEEQLQPKRARSDADAGDAYEIPAEVDNWDLRDHRQGNVVWVEFGCPGHGKGPWDSLGAMVNTKVTLYIMHDKERTITGKITSSILVAQHL